MHIYSLTPLRIHRLFGSFRHHHPHHQGQGGCPRRAWAGCHRHGGTCGDPSEPGTAAAEGCGRWGRWSHGCHGYRAHDAGFGAGTDAGVAGGAAESGEGAGVEPTDAQGRHTGDAAQQWAAELRLLRDMGIDVDAEVLCSLLAAHRGTIAAVIAQLFAN